MESVAVEVGFVGEEGGDVGLEQEGEEENTASEHDAIRISEMIGIVYDVRAEVLRFFVEGDVALAVFVGAYKGCIAQKFAQESGLGVGH